jgi:hypothetical protein
MSTEKELAEALLKLDVKGNEAASDACLLAKRIIRRDRLLLRVLGWSAIVLWSVAAAAFYGLTFLVVELVTPKVMYLSDQAYVTFAQSDKQPNEAKKQPTAPQHRRWYNSHSLVSWLIFGSAASIVLAAATTIRLISASRRAGLRQINANLLEISNQLKRLRQTSKET